MHKNIAIILGVTDYQEPNVPLPGCANDVALMEALTRRGGEFDEVVVLQSGDSESVKSQLADVIRRNEYEDIGHLFFYFTGHGEVVDDDFFYQLRDYDEAAIKRTSILNSDLDQMLLSLNPALLGKVVDACYSGVSYIKDGSSRFGRYKDFVKGNHPKVYFMASSDGDQRSYAEAHVSDFTREFVRAVVSHRGDSVRYKSIADYLSDKFERAGGQRPFFVMQGNQTEIFGTYSIDVKNVINAMLPALDPEAVEVKLPVTDTQEMEEVVSDSEEASLNNSGIDGSNLVQLVTRDAQPYASQAEAQEHIQALHHFLDVPRVSYEVTQLFEISVNFSGRCENIGAKHIGNWLQKNTQDRYFAEPTYEEEEYEVPLSGFFGSIAVLTGEQTKKVLKKRSVVSGFYSSLSSSMPFSVCTVLLRPKLPNLTQYGADFAYVVSKRYIQIFYRFKKYKEIDWGSFASDSAGEWTRVQCMTKDISLAEATVSEFYSAFYAWVVSDINKVYEKSDP